MPEKNYDTAEKAHTIGADGSLDVVYTEGPDAQGAPQVTRWHVPPSQLERHAIMFEGEMRAGDKSAFADAVREFAKQRGR